MVAFGSFTMVKCYNWASNNATSSLLYADMFEIYIRSYKNVMNLYRQSHISLSGLMLKVHMHQNFLLFFLLANMKDR